MFRMFKCQITLPQINYCPSCQMPYICVYLSSHGYMVSIPVFILAWATGLKPNGLFHDVSECGLSGVDPQDRDAWRAGVQHNAANPIEWDTDSILMDMMNEWWWRKCSKNFIHFNFFNPSGVENRIFQENSVTTCSMAGPCVVTTSAATVLKRQDNCILIYPSGPRLNIKTVFPRYGDSHVKDKTVGETVLSLTWGSLYW